MSQNQTISPVNQTPTKAVNDGIMDQATIDRFNRLRVQQASRLATAKGGQLWTGGNPTPGTGIASHAAPTATDGTKPLATFLNNYAVGSGKNIYLERVKFAVTVAGANATASRIVVEKSAQGVSRFTSGGSTNLASAALVANNCGVAPYSTSMVLRLGAVVAPADTAALLLAKGDVRSIIPKVSDQIIIDFSDVQETSGATLLDFANAGAIVTRLIVDPIQIGPGETLLIHLVNAAQSAASSYEMSASWREEG